MIVLKYIREKHYCQFKNLIVAAISSKQTIGSIFRLWAAFYKLLMGLTKYPDQNYQLNKFINFYEFTQCRDVYKKKRKIIWESKYKHKCVLIIKFVHQSVISKRIDALMTFFC